MPKHMQHRSLPQVSQVNGPLLEELVTCRHQAAVKLGFSCHAERMLAQKMATRFCELLVMFGHFWIFLAFLKGLYPFVFIFIFAGFLSKSKAKNLKSAKNFCEEMLQRLQPQRDKDLQRLSEKKKSHLENAAEGGRKRKAEVLEGHSLDPWMTEKALTFLFFLLSIVVLKIEDNLIIPNLRQYVQKS